MRLRLHHRLALPFAAVGVFTAALATLYAVREAQRWVSDRRSEDAVSTAQLVQRADYATNPAVLKVAAELTHVEVVTLGIGGVVVASSFRDEVPAELVALVRKRVALMGSRPEDSPEAAATAMRETDCGETCFIAYHSVMGQPGLFVAVIAGRGAVDTLSQRVVRTIWLAAAIGVVLIVGTSQILARMLTGPIQRLVDFARQVSPTSEDRRAAEGDDDIGRLGAAFNAMLDRLAESRRALIRSEKLALAGLMAARVAHDVRNPLSSIKMQAQLLSALTPEGTEQARILVAVLHDIDQLDSVVRDLLETARPEALQFAPVRMAELVRQVIAPLELQLAHRRIHLQLTLDEAAPAVMLDAARFRRALVNVLANAADASRAGGTIEVAARVVGDAHVLEVIDDGVGLDPAIAERLFDPFVSSKPDGVGLGLVNARTIVESHGGRIVIEPRQPRGTRVTMTLPIKGPGVAVSPSSGVT